MRSVWYRSPTGFRVDPRMSEAERRYAESEARLGLGGLLLSAHNALWVNHPGREADADYKPHQLVTARRCRLRTPQTLLTNEPDAVWAFAAATAGSCPKCWAPTSSTSRVAARSPIPAC